MFGGFKKMLYLCKLKEKPPFSGKNARDWIMKDRIRQIMESKHMTQQVFADYIGTTPATLSGIFNDRTRPTINIVESIKKKIPDINTDWLMFGIGDMYHTPTQPAEEDQTAAPMTQPGARMTENDHFNFPEYENNPAPTPRNQPSAARINNSVRTTHQNFAQEETKYFDKPTRHVTEIRVYYDDQTWESFKPAK